MNFGSPEPAKFNRDFGDKCRSDTDDTSCSSEAPQLVREALDLATRDPELSPEGFADASGICRVLLELSVDRYGRRGKEVLMESGIVTSEDVGSILSRLIEAGGAKSFGDGPMNDFDRIFDLREPPETWQLRW